MSALGGNRITIISLDFYEIDLTFREQRAKPQEKVVLNEIEHEISKEVKVIRRL